MILGRIVRLRRGHLLCLHLLSSFLKPSLKAIFHAISSLAARFWTIYTSDIHLRSFFSHNCLVKVLIIVTPPLWIYKGIQ